MRKTVHRGDTETRRRKESLPSVSPRIGGEIRLVAMSQDRSPFIRINPRRGRSNLREEFRDLRPIFLHHVLSPKVPTTPRRLELSPDFLSKTSRHPVRHIRIILRMHDHQFLAVDLAHMM